MFTDSVDFPGGNFFGHKLLWCRIFLDSEHTVCQRYNCQSGKFWHSSLQCFPSTIDTDLSFANFGNCKRVVCIGEQCLSSCHGLPDSGHVGLVAIRISTVTLSLIPLCRSAFSRFVMYLCNFSLSNFTVHS